MILSESLWPGMTRRGQGYKNFVPVRQSDRETFPVTSRELWLPPVAVSDRTLLFARAAAINQLRQRPEGAKNEFLYARTEILKSINVNENGCWLLGDEISDDEHTRLLWDIVDDDMGGEPLNPVKTKDTLRVCDESSCLCPRHYDFTHRVLQRSILYSAPNYEDFVIHDGQGVQTIWERESGMILPTVDVSIECLRALQRRCLPYVSDEVHAPLSSTNISKISVDPVTGCWPVRSYYVRPADVNTSYQYDGYGRLSPGKELQLQGLPSYGQMAHRVILLTQGVDLKGKKEVNHECGFRPCAYPGHLSVVSKEENVRHGRRMSSARRDRHLDPTMN